MDPSSQTTPQNPVEAAGQRFKPLSDDQYAERQQAAKRAEERQENERRFSIWRKCVGDEQSPYWGCSLDSFDAPTPAHQEVLAACREYCDDLPGRLDRSENVLLYGPCGTGKDHLALAIVRAQIRALGHESSWVFCADWFGRIRDAMDGEQTTERQLIDELSSTRWLILSDPLPPVGNLTPHQATMLFRVMDARAKQRCVTITTINVKDGGEAVARMGASTWDRMKHNAWVIACNWASNRKPLRTVGVPK